MKKATKLLALFLALALVMQMLPVSVIADQAAAVGDTAESPHADDVSSAASAEERQDPVVLGEVTDRRGEREKHFRMNDGSFVAVDYGAPVHFTSDGGSTWADIDNTLTPSRDDAGLYTARNGESVRGFASELRDGRLMTVSDGAYSLRMYLAGSDDSAGTRAYNSASAAEISYPDAKTRGNEELSFAEQITPSKLRADVLYRNVCDGVDLQYELYSRDVKETILINRTRDSYAFSFRLETDGLTPELTQDGSVELRNAGGETVYLIPAPYMTDAAGAFSDAVSYALEKLASGSWELTVTADDTWINAESRALPVSIDPTVILYPYSGNNSILTSYVNSDRPTTASYCNAYYLRSGYCTNTPYDPDCTGYTVGLIYFKTLPKVPDNCIVTDAQLGLKARHICSITITTTGY